MCTATVHLSLELTVIGPCLLPGKKGEGPFQLAHAPFHLLQAFHHLLELRVLLQEPVDVGDLGAAALGDARAAAAVDDLRLHPLLGRHRADDGLVLLEILVLAPAPTKAMGRPVTSRTERAAPPRASPSILVRITASMPTATLNLSATVMASWPVMASTTRST